MRTIKEVLAFNIRRLRGDRTQEEMAEFLGLNIRTYQRLEKGTRPQGATMGRVLARLAKIGIKSEVSLVQLPGEEPAKLPSENVHRLAAVIQDQERRIRELEARLVQAQPPHRAASTNQGTSLGDELGEVGSEARAVARAWARLDPEARGDIEALIEENLGPDWRGSAAKKEK